MPGKENKFVDSTVKRMHAKSRIVIIENCEHGPMVRDNGNAITEENTYDDLGV